MPLPISDTSIKLVWENNPDTSLTSTNLSKGTDYIGSYLDYDTGSLHNEGSILAYENETGNGLWIKIKRGTVISLINTVEKNGEKILSENENYRLFDVGLDDIWLTPNDMDDNNSNPSGNWGINKEWFVYICDKMDDSLLKTDADEYGGGAQILISQGRNYPIGQIPGDPTINYSPAGTRKIGGFKSDAFGKIVQNSLWDISQRNTVVRAKDYYIFDEYAQSVDDYNRFINRKLRLTDLDTFSLPLLYGNSLTVKDLNSTIVALNVDTLTNITTINSLSTPTISATTITATNITANQITATLNGNATTATTANNALACSGNATTSGCAARLGINNATGIQMIFNWSGQSGQPTWLWGGNDTSNMYVYNPSNFSVSHSATSGVASLANKIRTSNPGTVSNGDIWIE